MSVQLTCAVCQQFVNLLFISNIKVFAILDAVQMVFILAWFQSECMQRSLLWFSLLIVFLYLFLLCIWQINVFSVLLHLDNLPGSYVVSK